MNITTQHGMIGYTENVQVIERALREKFGVDDNSHVATAVAAHIWSAMCMGLEGRAGENCYIWGTPEIESAIRRIQHRLARIEAVALLVK